MASLPLQFTDPSLQQQLQSARSLDDRNATAEFHSGIEALDECFAQIRPGDLVEWGIPPGFNGRLIPLQLLKQDTQRVDLSSPGSRSICVELD